jgi:hypothetical protein
MDAAALRELQRPLKTKYRESPDAANTPLTGSGRFEGDGITATVGTAAGAVVAGLHPATGGTVPRRAPATCCSRRSSPAPA